MCDLQTIVGVENIEDEYGEPTSERAVIAMCDGNIKDNCGWSERLTEFDKHPEEWWITSGEMAALDAAHREAGADE